MGYLNDRKVTGIHQGGPNSPKNRVRIWVGMRIYDPNTISQPPKRGHFRPGFENSPKILEASRIIKKPNKTAAKRGKRTGLMRVILKKVGRIICALKECSYS